MNQETSRAAIALHQLGMIPESLSTGSVVINVPGEFVGKQRARSSRLKNGKTMHYTPEKTRTWEGICKSLAMYAMQHRQPFERPVEMRLAIIYKIPPSWPKWKHDLAMEGKIEPTVKPDADNVCKAVKDALNGVAWIDDAQVVKVGIDKIYGRQAAVYIAVIERGAYPAQIKHKP